MSKDRAHTEIVGTEILSVFSPSGSPTSNRADYEVQVGKTAGGEWFCQHSDEEMPEPVGYGSTKEEAMKNFGDQLHEHGRL